MTETFSFTLEPVPPFNFSLTTAIFASGDLQIRISTGTGFMHAIEAGGMPVLIRAGSDGSLSRPKIAVECRTTGPARQPVKTAVRQAVARIFSTDDDLESFYAAVSGDPIMALLTRRLRGLRCPATPTFFEALIDSVIEQQISLVAARSVENRLIRAVGRPVQINGDTWYCYPSPEVLAEVTDTLFRACGLTIRKGEYIRGISRQVVDGDLDLERFRGIPDTESVIAELIKIRGIGRWTAELAILRGLHRPDAFPADDVGVRRFISRFYAGGEKVSPALARQVAERWGKYCGFAAYYLEVAELLRIQPADLDQRKKHS